LSKNVFLQVKEKVELPSTSRMQIPLLIREGKSKLNNAEKIHVALKCLQQRQIPNSETEVREIQVSEGTGPLA
jgi:hypothetical protein